VKKKSRLISVHELRALGALDVPPEWRKSLSAKREYLPLFGDDDRLFEKEQPTPRDDDGNQDGAESVDESSTEPS
jgi:hypothetical protein